MKRYNINWTAKTLNNQMAKNNVNFDCSVQRGYVWDNERKSLLIHSMIYNYAIPALYFVKNEDGTYDALDGKQRSNAISGFLNGEYALSENTPVVYDENGNELDISGLFFENLPEWAQDSVKDYSLTIYYYEDMSEQDVREFFRRLNNGKPLTAVELTRVKAKSMDVFKALAGHEAIQSVVTDKGKARFNDENIAMQICAMAYMETPSFGTKEFRPWIENAVITDEQKNKVVVGLDMLNNFIADYLTSDGLDEKEVKRVARKIKMRTHFVSMAYFGMLCAENNVEQCAFNEAVFNFFACATTSMDNGYNASVGSGSAKAEAVAARKSAVEGLFNKMGVDVPF